MIADRMSDEEFERTESLMLMGAPESAMIAEARRSRASESALLEASEAALGSLMDPNAGQADTLRLLRTAIAKASRDGGR